MTDFSLEIIDPLRYPGWDDLVEEQKTYSFFHSSHWARVLQEAYRYRPVYFIRNDQRVLRALIPLMEVRSILTGKRAVGLPFTDYSNPALEEERCPDVMEQIARFGRQEGWDSIELRTGNGNKIEAPCFSSYFVHTLDLSPGPDAVFAAFREMTRKNIRKAVREGVTVGIDASLSSLETFCRLNCETRKEHGLPPQPSFFFKKIHEHILSRGLGCVALAFHGPQAVAGAVYFYDRGQSIYKYGASLRRFQHLRPNNLVMWEAIQWLSRRGCRSLCFGRTEPQHAGLRQYKAGWGTEERVINYYKYDLRNDSFVPGRPPSSLPEIGASILMHLPIPLLKVAGRILYRHVG